MGASKAVDCQATAAHAGPEVRDIPAIALDVNFAVGRIPRDMEEIAELGGSVAVSDWQQLDVIQ
jgi:hypothetical protein